MVSSCFLAWFSVGKEQCNRKWHNNNTDEGSWATWSNRCIHQCCNYQRMGRQAVGKKAAFSACRRIPQLTPFRATWSTYISADDITGSIWFLLDYLMYGVNLILSEKRSEGGDAAFAWCAAWYWSACCCVFAGPALLYLLDWLRFETIHSLLTLSLLIGTCIILTKN